MRTRAASRGLRHGAEDTGLRSPDDRAARRMGRRVGPAGFRDDIESTLQAFVAHAGRMARRARSRRAAPGRARPHQHPRRQALPGGVLLVGTPRGRRARSPGRRRSRCCARARPWSCCTPAPWSTTTTWTPPTYAAAGRPPTAPSSRSTASTAGPPSPEQYGASAAILLGDLLLSWSDELLRTCGLPAERVLEALGYFDLTRSEVVAGQFLDVSAQARGAADVDTAMTVLRYKSAKYSIERPLHIGAALAGASAEQITQLSRFGLPLGEAFQLRDDLLGVFGDPAVTGKPAGDDLIEGKRTVLVSLALDALPGPDAKVLDSALGTRARPGPGRDPVPADRGVRSPAAGGGGDQRAHPPVARRRSPRPRSATGRAAYSKGWRARSPSERSEPRRFPAVPWETCTSRVATYGK